MILPKSRLRPLSGMALVIIGHPNQWQIFYKKQFLAAPGLRYFKVGLITQRFMQQFPQSWSIYAVRLNYS
jgi:hypothetical protein